MTSGAFRAMCRRSAGQTLEDRRPLLFCIAPLLWREAVVVGVALGGVDTYRIHKMMAARVTTAW
jgi:hypothetical protein